MTLAFLLVLAALPAQSTTKPAPVSAGRPMPIEITVRCYDRLQPALRGPAQRTLARIAHTAALEWKIAWKGCFEDSNNTRDQEQPAADAGHPRLTIAILQLAMARTLESDEDQMGMTPRSQQAAGRLAYVFYDRVEYFAHHFGTVAGQVLAAAIAHELGHILLPYPSHSAAGLMRATWTLKEFQDLARGWLLFTPAQAQALRNGLAGARLLDDAAGPTEDTRHS